MKKINIERFLKLYNTFIPLSYEFYIITENGNSLDKRLKESVKSTTQYFKLPTTEEEIDKYIENSSSSNDTQVKFLTIQLGSCSVHLYVRICVHKYI